jgi:tetratricopeptide (TPR) repeat protein
MNRGLALLGGALLTIVAAAVTTPCFAEAETGRWIGPPSNLPHPQHGERGHNLDFLFEALKIAPDETSAKAIEDRIWAVWLTSHSDTCNLLMTRAKTAIDAEQLDLAVKLLDAVVELRPDYLEAWNRRATVFYLKKEYGHALSDIGQVLAREPRHFGALAGMGTILEDLGDDKHALEAFRRALAVDPHLEGIDEKVKTLSEKVEGRDI